MRFPDGNCSLMDLIFLKNNHDSHAYTPILYNLNLSHITNDATLITVIFVIITTSPYTKGLKVQFDKTLLYNYSPSSLMTDIPLTERQGLKDDHLSMSRMFFSLPLGIGPIDKGPPFKLVIRATVYLPVLWFKHVSSVFLDECYPLDHSEQTIVSVRR